MEFKGTDIIQTTIRIPASLKEKLQVMASKRGYTVKDLILFILYVFFENKSQE